MEKPVNTQYRPKGGMCTTCHFALGNCSRLPFERMPVIGKDSDGLIVKCLTHKRKTAKTG